jgi:hypothetical protein
MRLEMAKRAVQPGEVRSVLDPAHQALLENRVRLFKPVGSFLYPSPARSGPKRAGPAR